MTRNFLVFIFGLFILLVFTFAFCYVSIYSENLISGIFALVGYVAVTGYLAATVRLAIPWHPGGLAAALGAGICLAFGLICFFKALAAGPQVAVVVPLTALYPLVTVILSWTLLREGFSVRQLAGLALALPAVWLLSSCE